MAKKKTSPGCKSKNTQAVAKAEQKPHEDYNRDFIIQELIRTAEGDGMAKIGALKELRSMLAEETPPVELEVDIAFVNLVFDDENFRADKANSVML
jgi:hypothetical protein